MSGPTAGTGGEPAPTALGVGSPLVTDLYEVTMALAYLREGLTAPATFSLITRELGAERGFLVAAGLADVLEHLERFHVGEDHLEVFADVLHRPVAALRPLAGMRFTGEVRAVPEGRVVLGGEPLLELTGPLPRAMVGAPDEMQPRSFRHKSWGRTAIARASGVRGSGRLGCGQEAGGPVRAGHKASSPTQPRSGP